MNAPTGKLLTACCYAAFIATGLSAGLLGPTLVGLARQTNSSFAEIGFVFSVHSLGYIVGSTVFGRLFDKVGGHRIFAAMIGGLSIALFTMSNATSLGLLLAGALLLGTAEGVGQVGVNTLLVWAYGERATPYLNGAHLCFGIGALTSPIIVGQLYNAGYDFRIAYRAVAVAILLAVPLFLLVRSPEIRSTPTPSETPPVSMGLVLSVVLFYFLYLGTEISFGGWISAFAVATHLSDEATASYLASAFWSSLTAGRLLAIALSLKVKPRTLLIADLLGALLGLGVIAFANDLTGTLVGTILVGASLASVYPTMFSFAGNRLEITGRVAGWFVMGGSLGSMVFPFLAGLLFDKTGPKSLIAMTSIMAATALAILFAILFAFPKARKS